MRGDVDIQKSSAKQMAKTLRRLNFLIVVADISIIYPFVQYLFLGMNQTEIYAIILYNTRPY